VRWKGKEAAAMSPLIQHRESRRPMTAVKGAMTTMTITAKKALTDIVTNRTA
jgi:hypothetical protein